MMCKKSVLQILIIGFLASVMIPGCSNGQPAFEGQYIAGSGDEEYLELLDKAYRMMRPDAELEHLSMLYHTEWNGFVEGPTWNAWWIQNSFGPTYTLLPFMDKAYQIFIANSQALWFRHMGNDERKDRNGYMAPKGSLCDCAGPDWVIYRQGDGKHKIHDWGFGFTAAGIILQSELLLIQRDMESIREYLPLLEQCADFIDSRRDPEKHIFLIGTAGNLLAPSYAGSGKQLEDGSYEMAYLAEISVNYIAGLDRLIELEIMLGRIDKADLYRERRDQVKEGLKYFTTDEGYFIRALEKDGTKHGVFGAPEYGYFAATPNHDAMALRVVDDEQALSIYTRINSIPGLRPNKLILPNYPGYDDMYETKGLFTFGRWVNGGHWTTCEGRMQLGYYRVGAYDDAKEGFKKILDMCKEFKLDNPLPEFGAALYQPKLPINCVYDCWGAPGGFLRGLFEYEYKAEGMRIYPHIPAGITQLQQKFPVYFGDKQIYIMTHGTGPITSVLVNGTKTEDFDPGSMFLKMNAEAGVVFVSLGLGNQPAKSDFTVIEKKFQVPDDEEFWNIDKLLEEGEVSSDEMIDESELRKIWGFYTMLYKENLSNSYEYKHAELILENIQAIYERRKLKQTGQLLMLPQESQIAADKLYVSTVKNLYTGLINHLEKNRTSSSEQEQRIASIWFEIFQLPVHVNVKEAYELKIKAPIKTWDEAIPLGNGLTGCLVWGEKNHLRFSFDRGDLWDNRVPSELKEPGFTYANLQKLVKDENAEEISRLTDKPYNYPYPTKLPGVRLELELKSDFHAKTFGLDMERALCTVESVSGESLSVFTSATKPVTFIRCPDYVIASLKVPTSVKELGFPEPQSGSEGDNLWWKQETVEELEYGAYMAVKKVNGECLIALSFTSNEDADDYMALAKTQAQESLQEGFEKLMAEHEKWWTGFWSASDINLPDLKHQRYYYLMQYYYGSASRKGYPPMPLQGLWTADHGKLPPWKGDFHNDMNVQMCYWAYYASGRFESGESLIDFLLDLAPAHRRFAKDFFGVDGLMVPGVMGLKGQPLVGWAQYTLSPTMSVWLLQNIYWHWRHTMDEKFLREKCYPYCKEMAVAMEALLIEDENGKLKLLLSTSPEIHNNTLRAWLTPNTNNDQALLIWMADAMVEMADAQNIRKDVKHWKKFRSGLEELVVDENNVLRLSPTESLKESHRHHAHLMAIYPLGVTHIEGSQHDKEVVIASLDDLKKLGTEHWVGFSFPWASCLEARAGRADEAFRYLNIFVEAFTSPNGFNLNGDQSGMGYSNFTYRPFTLDANFGASQAIHEMLLQSWGGKVRIFPAVPTKWQDVSFRDLRAEGGFIISAERKAGQTVSLQIKAVVDSKLKMKDPFGGKPAKWNRSDIIKVGEYYECTLKAGEELKSMN